MRPPQATAQSSASVRPTPGHRVAEREMAARAAAGAGGDAMPPLPPGAEKHAAALWTFLDELSSSDPEARAHARAGVSAALTCCATQAYARFIDEQAKAAGVDDFAAFRSRMAQPRGAGAAAAAAASPETLAAVAAAAAREAGGRELPPELLTRLAALGTSPAGGAGPSSTATPAKSPARRAPLVQELPSADDNTAAPAQPASNAPPSPATAAPARSPPRAAAPHLLSVEAACAREPHGAVVLSVQLFDISSAAEVSLEASEWEAVLLRAGADAAAPPLLRVALPARCLADAATARWDKRAKRLTVRMPRAPPV